MIVKVSVESLCCLCCVVVTGEKVEGMLFNSSWNPQLHLFTDLSYVQIKIETNIKFMSIAFKAVHDPFVIHLKFTTSADSMINS